MEKRKYYILISPSRNPFLIQTNPSLSLTHPVTLGDILKIPTHSIMFTLTLSNLYKFITPPTPAACFSHHIIDMPLKVSDEENINTHKYMEQFSHNENLFCYLLVSPCSPNIPVGTAFSNASQPHSQE
jgi:hypothetical protein